MTGSVDAQRVLDAFLAPEHDQLADRVLEAALADIARTPQRRAWRVPWRFPNVTPLIRVAVVAAVLVAVLGGGAIFLAGSGMGPGPTPTVAPTPTATPAPSPVTTGISSFVPYTSAEYGFTLGYPSDWTVVAPASRPWKASDADASGGSWPYADLFANVVPSGSDEIGLWAWRMEGGPGVEANSLQDLTTYAEENLCARHVVGCTQASDVAIPMCLGREACRPAVLVPLPDGVSAYFYDLRAGMVTIVELGRPDAFPAAARYGGGVQLLKSILTTMDVWTPEPGQAPAP